MLQKWDLPLSAGSVKHYRDSLAEISCNIVQNDNDGSPAEPFGFFHYFPFPIPYGSSSFRSLLNSKVIPAMVPVSLFYMPSYAWSDRMMKQKPKWKFILRKRHFFTYLGFIKDKFLLKRFQSVYFRIKRYTKKMILFYKIMIVLIKVVQKKTTIFIKNIDFFKQQYFILDTNVVY